MTQLSINLPAYIALPGTMTATDTIIVAIGTAKTDEMNGVETVMVTGVVLGARLVVR